MMSMKNDDDSECGGMGRIFYFIKINTFATNDVTDDVDDDEDE